MNNFNRRHFLQFAGSTLATLGLSQLDIQIQGNKYAKVLAQSTPRKLALLVGINDYPNTSNFAPLKGCLTDVELQQKLLVHRFNFNPQDIYTLTNAQATRKGILEAFEEHLIKQAKPGDVVVFHYSGHGSRVIDPDKDNPDGLNSTFVPIDAPLPKSGGVVQDITGHTLFLLMSALQTENVTAVLDSCHSGGGTRGNFRIRSRAGGSKLEISPDEKAYQEQWLSRLKMSPEDFIKLRRQGVAKGTVLAAAKRNQYAADASLEGFYAGAFTYMMSQYIWQETGTIESAIANVTRNIQSLSRQVPLSDVKPQSGNEQKPVYFISNPQIPKPAEAVITDIQGKQAKLWLGGLDRGSLEAFDKGAIFTIVSDNGSNSGQVTLESRQGLIATASLESVNTKQGALLQEAARAIPNNLKLRIGIDPSLSASTNIVQTLQKIKRVEGVPAKFGNEPYTGQVQYILSRMTAAYRQDLQNKGVNNLAAENSIGLFSQGIDEIIPDSFGEVGETESAAISRLETKLKSLLAARIIKLALNAESSRLNLEVSMNLEDQPNKFIAQAFTVRGGVNRNRGLLPSSPKLGVEKPFQFQVKNNESRPLYISILLIQPGGTIVVIFPNQWGGAEKTTRLEANQTRLIPDPNLDNFQIFTQAKGIGEALIIASPKPFKKALLSLSSLAQEQGQTNSPIALGGGSRGAEDVMGDFLSDLGASDRSGVTVAGSHRINAAEIAALSITFEVV